MSSNEIREATTPKQRQALAKSVREGVPSPAANAAAIAESERLSRLDSSELATYQAVTGFAEKFWSHLPPTPKHVTRQQVSTALDLGLQLNSPNRTTGKRDIFDSK